MINYNGQIYSDNFEGISYNNRAFKYGDAVFETIKFDNESVVYSEDHYFRLMASMRMLRMEIPMEFTYEFFENEILKTINANIGDENRVKFTVYRDSEGLYTPNSNKIAYLIEVKKVVIAQKESYKIDLYKDFMVTPGILSTVKTTNKMINVLASIYAKENDLDNCVLLNTNKNIIEFTNGNIFLVKGKTISTPKLADGCIKGVMRKNLIELIEKNTDYIVEEVSISPFAIQKADEVFMTNVISGLQSVTHYRKKVYQKTIANKFKALI